MIVDFPKSPFIDTSDSFKVTFQNKIYIITISYENISQNYEFKITKSR